MGTQVGRVDAVRHPAAAAVVVRQHRRLRADLLPADRRAALLLLVHRRLHRDGLPVADAGGAGALRSDDHRLQPGGHVRRRSHPPRAARRFPACSPASASSRIHKEFVSSKIAGETASLTNPGARSHPRLRRRGRARRDPAQRHRHAVPEAGAGAVSARRRSKALLRRHPKTTIIWAHIGLGRIVHPARSEADRARPITSRSSRRSPNPALAHVSLRHLLGRGREVHRRDAGERSQRVGRSASTAIPIGSCSAPTKSRRPTQAAYFRSIDMYAPLLRAADARGEREGPQGQLRAALRRGRRKVRAWEKANVK